MVRKILFVASTLAIVAAVPNLASAKSVKSQITRESLQELCGEMGLGEFKVNVKLPSGEIITGSVHCEAEDMPGAVDSASSREDDDHSSSSVEDDDDEDDDGGHHGSSSSEHEHEDSENHDSSSHEESSHEHGGESGED